MSHEPRMLLVSGEGTRVVRSPGVGLAELHVRDGQIVGAGDRVGTLRTLHERVPLQLPSGTFGRVQLNGARMVHQVAWGAELFTLAAVEGDAGAVLSTSVDADGTAWRAPMDGMFYRRSGPGAPAFVEEGATIVPGATIGLIEVMKFFYPIRFEGTEPRTLLRWVAADGAAIEAGAVILLLG